MLCLRDINQRQITQKNYIVEIHLQWRTSRQLYMVYQTVPVLMVLKRPLTSV